MKYKVGDKVRVRKGLKKGYDYGIYVNSLMTEYANKIVVISKVREDYYEYLIKEDNNNNDWTDNMFEGKVNEM